MSLSSLYVVGVNHKSANTSLREKIAIDASEIVETLTRLKNISWLDEAVVLSTCNRLEIIGWTAEHQVDESHLVKLVTDVFDNKNLDSHDLSREIEESINLYRGRDALEYVLSIPSGLESLVLGETQIVGQFKKSFEIAISNDLIGTHLNRLFDHALRASKKIRTETSIGEKTVSVSHAAIDMAKNLFGDLSQHGFLFIGAGEMVRLAATYAETYRPKHIRIANRTFDNANRLTKDLGYGEAFSLNDLPNLLAEADVILSSTAAQEHVIDKELLRKVMKSREGKPLFLVDIAVPRDIDPTCADIEDVYLFELDDLKQLVEENLSLRKDEAEKAKLIVESAAHQFEAKLGEGTVAESLAQLRDYFEQVLHLEMNKTVKKMNLTSSDGEDIIQKLKKPIINRIQKDIAVNLKKTNMQYSDVDVSNILKLLFKKD